MSSRNLSIQERSRIIALHEEGLNISQISRELGLTRNTVRLWVNRFGDEGHLDTRSRQPEQPFSISAEQVNIYSVEPFTPTRRYAEEFDCSVRTVRRTLHRAGVHHRRPAKKIILSERNKIDRVRFAREYRDFDFSRAIFADEKCFKSSQLGRRHLWRVDNTRYEPRNVNPNNESGRICANMWGWMSAAGPGELVAISGRTNGQAYLELLQEALIPTARVVYPESEVPELIFLQDPHCARGSKLAPGTSRYTNGAMALPFP
ncbi:hypothetical protein evm_013985 [Chilo suppressalis]|nr:hypothetical protein evm_013985 [Chilo suppressalis]